MGELGMWAARSWCLFCWWRTQRWRQIAGITPQGAKPRKQPRDHTQISACSLCDFAPAPALQTSSWGSLDKSSQAKTITSGRPEAQRIQSSESFFTCSTNSGQRLRLASCNMATSDAITAALEELLLPSILLALRNLSRHGWMQHSLPVVANKNYLELWNMSHTTVITRVTKGLPYLTIAANLANYKKSICMTRM